MNTMNTETFGGMQEYGVREGYLIERVLTA